MAAAPENAHFEVHVFLHHDPYLASTFLPELFSTMPDSVWRLPALIEESPQTDSAGSRVSPRDALGRYILPQSLAGSTTLQELLDLMQNEFGLQKSWLAKFTIYPSWWMTMHSPWENKPLPDDMTIAQARNIDQSATDKEIVPENVVHLVLTTKAAALPTIVSKGYLARELGRAYEFSVDVDNRFDSFYSAYMTDPLSLPRSFEHLREFRHLLYAVAYLKREREKQRARGDDGKERVDDLIHEIEQLEKSKAESKEALLIGVREWASCILNTDQTNLDQVPDDDIERTMRWLWETKCEFVERWKASDHTQKLKDSLQQKYAQANPGMSNFRSQPIPPRNPVHDVPEDALPEHSAVKTISFRDSKDKLVKDQSTFTVTSGILLWGHVLPIYYGWLQGDLTENAANVPNQASGGTIRVWSHTYRSAARDGVWKTRRYYSNWGGGIDADEPPSRHTGWVIFHEDCDPLELIRQARAIQPTNAISLGNDHIDKDTKYVNRYDWSWHWRHPTDKDFEKKFQEFAEPALGPGPTSSLDDEDNSLRGGYFTALDAENFGLDWLRALKVECQSAQRRRPVEKVFAKNDDGRRFGSYVQMQGTEYEFGWLVFSGKKHSEHDADELIGIIYDGEYEVLEGMDHAVEPEPEQDGGDLVNTD